MPHDVQVMMNEQLTLNVVSISHFWEKRVKCSIVKCPKTNFIN